MNRRQLQIFLNLAETLNFARAAELSHLSQPALTLAVQSLERSLGGKLFSRTTRRVRLTPEGEMLLPRARQLLAEWEDTEEMLRYRFTLKRGRVTVAAMPSFAGALLPGLLLKYRRGYPLIDVAIQDVIHEQVVELVQKGRVEMGICFEPEAAEHLEFTPLFRDRFIAIVPAGAKFAKKRQVTWAELLKFPFITLQRPSTVRRLLERTLEETGVGVHVAMECHQLATVGNLVARGLGVSAVPALCRVQMTKLGARCLTLSSPMVERSVGLIRRRDTELSTAARALFEMAMEVKPENT